MYLHVFLERNGTVLHNISYHIWRKNHQSGLSTLHGSLCILGCSLTSASIIALAVALGCWNVNLAQFWQSFIKKANLLKIPKELKLFGRPPPRHPFFFHSHLPHFSSSRVNFFFFAAGAARSSCNWRSIPTTALPSIFLAQNTSGYVLRFEALVKGLHTLNRRQFYVGRSQLQPIGSYGDDGMCKLSIRYPSHCAA